MSVCLLSPSPGVRMHLAPPNLGLPASPALPLPLYRVSLQPDRMLLVDRPPGDKLRSQMKILLIWTVLEAFAVVAMANRVSAAWNAADAATAAALH